MRIIAGYYRGRRIQALDGLTTRPTTDRVKESLMSAIASARGGFEGALVFDAFAGSGALGLEAISRGAQHVSFCERDLAAFRILKKNIESLDISQTCYSLFNKDSFTWRPQEAIKPFDLVFFDPPYNLKPKHVVDLIQNWYKVGVIDSRTLIVYEHAKKMDSQLEESLNSLQCELVSHRNYGDTAIDIIALCDEKDYTLINRDEGSSL